MEIINWIKVGCILVCDFINKLYYPFELNTDLQPIAPLQELEKLFYTQIENDFITDLGEFLYEKPRPPDSGDTALWHSMYIAMKVLKGSNLGNELKFLKSLFINGVLIRGYKDDGTPNDTTSNDSATGVLFALYCMLRYGNSDVRNEAACILDQWLISLKANKWALVDLAGNPTKYGKLENGILTDPLRITLLLALLALGATTNKDWNYDYLYLFKKYKPLLKYPKVRLLWLDTNYDTHRAAIHLHVLYHTTGCRLYKEGLNRIYKMCYKENNAWVNTLCEHGEVSKILSTFSYNRRLLGNIESINNDWPSIKWGDKIRAKKALPLNRRGSQDFFWQRNMFSLNEWVGNVTPTVYHTGLDFLVCYWLAKRIKMI